MRGDLDAHRDVWGPVLALQLRAWTDTVFKQAALLQALGLHMPERAGCGPAPGRVAGAGPRYSSVGLGIELLPHEPAGYERMRYFDLAAEDYRAAVEPYSRPMLRALTSELEPHLVPAARVLDVGCGPGTEALALGALVPQGEVVGCDLSCRMLEQALLRAREAHANNLYFVQHDAQALPVSFNEAFDVVVCMLTFQFLVDGEAAASGFRRVLGDRGRVFIVDPGPDWFNAIAAPLSRLSNPAFVRYRNGAEFCELLTAVGFEDVYSREVLPGIDISSGIRRGGAR
jgi:ubiquinone/menaquinone biosynthesis C-methylase UbiE